MAKTMAQTDKRPVFGCAIGDKCFEKYRDPCSHDAICEHYVVVGCFQKPDGSDETLCSDGCHRFPCEIRERKAVSTDQLEAEQERFEAELYGDNN